jgi:hypothetical protein
MIPENNKQDYVYLCFDSHYGIKFNLVVSFNVAAAAHVLENIIVKKPKKI